MAEVATPAARTLATTLAKTRQGRPAARIAATTARAVARIRQHRLHVQVAATAVAKIVHRIATRRAERDAGYLACTVAIKAAKVPAISLVWALATAGVNTPAQVLPIFR